jgi:hypothetical protein
VTAGPTSRSLPSAAPHGGHFGADDGEAFALGGSAETLVKTHESQDGRPTFGGGDSRGQLKGIRRSQVVNAE